MINHFLVIIVKNKRFINVNFYNKTVNKMRESVYKKGFSIGLVLLFVIIGIFPAVSGYHHDKCEKTPLTFIRGNDQYVNITRPRGLVLLLAIIGIFPAVSGYHHDKCEKTSLTFIRGNGPYVNITRPREGYNYFNDEETIKVNGVEKVLVFGKVTVKADASPEIDKVVFWINDMDTFHDENAPYEWLWDFKLALGYNTVKVTGYDNGDCVAEDTIDVFSLMIKNC